MSHFDRLVIKVLKDAIVLSRVDGFLSMRRTSTCLRDDHVIADFRVTLKEEIVIES